MIAFALAGANTFEPIFALDHTNTPSISSSRRDTASMKNITLVNESSSYNFAQQSRLEFLRSHDGELITASETYAVEARLMDVIEFVTSTLADITAQPTAFRGLSNDHIEVLIIGNEDCMCILSR